MTTPAPLPTVVHLLWDRELADFDLPLFRVNQALHIYHFIIRKGFLTDGATLPGPVRSRLSPLGPYFVAAILHDYLLENSSMSRATCAHWFKRCLKDLGMSPWLYNPFYWAVRANDHYIRLKTEIKSWKR